MLCLVEWKSGEEGKVEGFLKGKNKQKTKTKEKKIVLFATREKWMEKRTCESRHCKSTVERFFERLLVTLTLNGHIIITIIVILF